MQRARYRQRGYIAVCIAVILVALLGFGALAIDMSMVVAAKGELRTTTNTAALATMDMVINLPADMPLELVRSTASEFAGDFLPVNPVLGRALEFRSNDVIIGKSLPDGAGRYSTFTRLSGEDTNYNALMLSTYLASERGQTQINPILGRILGREKYELSDATFAIIRPQNIAIVVDASGSMCYDSRFKWQLVRVMDMRDGVCCGCWTYPCEQARTNMDELWSQLPMQHAPYTGYVPEVHSEHPDWGPVYGFFMENAGYGTLDPDIDKDYRPRQYDEPNGDPGMLYLPRVVSWNNDSPDPDAAAQAEPLRGLLVSRGNYSPQERNAILDRLGGRWEDYVKVMLGLVGWNSGRTEPSSRWIQEGWDEIPDHAGKGDAIVDEVELLDIGVPSILSPPPSRLTWDRYIAEVESMDFSEADRPETIYADFRYCFGVKTVMSLYRDTLTRQEEEYDVVRDAFRGTSLQPWHSTRESISAFMDGVGAFDNSDRIALVRYGTESRIQMGFQGTEDLSKVKDALDWNAPYYGTTNIGDGIADATLMLTSKEPYTEGEWTPANPTALPPLDYGEDIIILLTDGRANEPGGEGEGGRYAEEKAAEAAALGIKIHTISIGSRADRWLCQRIADNSGGVHLEAGGDYIALQDQMTTFFNEELRRLRAGSLVVGNLHDVEYVP